MSIRDEILQETENIPDRILAEVLARCEVYEFNPATQGWIYSLRVP